MRIFFPQRPFEAACSLGIFNELTAILCNYQQYMGIKIKVQYKVSISDDQVYE